MRKAFLVLLAASLWPTWALATPSVEEIVSKAVEALRTTSYEARMKLVSHFEGGTEQVVRIYHVAPELYRVEQIVVGSFEAPAGAGAGDPGIVYIENAEELVRIRGKVVETMPLRRFHLNDALAIKFLRDLGRYPGTTVLNGWVGQYEVHVLRQEMGPNKPYTITFGVDQRNFFPVFLLVTESSGEPRVYYEMESITYLTSDELPDGLFTVPSPLDQTRLPSPRLKQRTASSLIPITQVSDSPLYPAALPEGYWIDSLISLDYLLGGAEAGLPVPVFQLDVYGPGFDELISIIQMRSQDSGFGIEDVMLWKPGCVVFERGGWIVAIFGELSDEQCALLVGGIAEDPEAVEDLLRQTSARDLILKEAEYYNP